MDEKVFQIGYLFVFAADTKAGVAGLSLCRLFTLVAVHGISFLGL
jgi:hypothetical protein